MFAPIFLVFFFVAATMQQQVIEGSDGKGSAVNKKVPFANWGDYISQKDLHHKYTFKVNVFFLFCFVFPPPPLLFFDCDRLLLTVVC